jgi:serine/threonine-protein kinase
MASISGEELAALNRLLGQGLELPEKDRARWLDRLPAAYDSLRPRLRRLLSDVRSIEGSSFLKTIPKVDAGKRASDDESDPAPGPGAIPKYRVLRKVASGGMGTVWLAHRTDVMVNRVVALKLPRSARLAVRFAERMAAEREILAALSHPNIARLYDAGVTSSGQPYLALEYVEGRPIDEYLAARHLPVRARLRLFLLVARALAHAHARLIVHRDLKPSNILVTDEGEVKLLDFGIAKLLDDRGVAEASAETSAHLLTPDYASPEQIAGDALGVATDVYSSGVILYELLAGTRPETRRCTVPPVRPSAVASDRPTRRALRGDLDAIVLKALEKRPDDRYATIDAFADDIDRYLRNYPVLARPHSAWYRVSKGIARNRLAVGAGASVLAAIIAGTGLAAWQAHVAFGEQARALEVKEFVTTVFRDASPYSAGGRALSAVEWLKQARSRIDRRLDDRPELRVELLNIVGSSLLNLQDTASAEDVLTQAIEEGTRRLGRDHPQTLRARVLMTPVRRFQGRTIEMRAELAQLLPILRATRGPLTEDLILALRNQAHVEIDEGRYQEAERAAQEAVEASLGTLGTEHPETVAALLMRAYAYQFSRPADAALAVSEDAYKAALRVFHDQPNHPRNIEGRLLYGRALGEAGDRVRAVEHLSRAVSDASDVFGPSSRMVGFFSLPLSEYQQEVGQIEEAIASSRHAVEIIERHTTPLSFRYAAAIHRRGTALLAARRAGDALPDLSRTTVILQQTLGASHHVTRWFQADEALALARAGRHREAQAVVRTLLPAAGAAVDPVGSKALYVMGLDARLTGDFRSALRFQQQALQATAPGPSAELRRMRALTELGLTLLALGSPDEALKSLEQALAISQQSQTHANPDRADIIDGLRRARAVLETRGLEAPARGRDPAGSEGDR